MQNGIDNKVLKSFTFKANSSIQLFIMTMLNLFIKVYLINK
jgi:hypothetical protein